MTFFEKNSGDWSAIIQCLFGIEVPNAAYWPSIDGIKNVLSHISSVDSVNYAIFPNGGGFGLTGAEVSAQHSLLELRFGSFVHICKPQWLSFVSLRDDSSDQWSYFYLKLADLDPIRPNEFSYSEFQQRLTELSSGVYDDPMVWENRAEYDSPKLPPTARAITRVLKGNIVIIQRASAYNSNANNLHHGEHHLMTPEQFRERLEAIRHWGGAGRTLSKNQES